MFDFSFAVNAIKAADTRLDTTIRPEKVYTESSSHSCHDIARQALAALMKHQGHTIAKAAFHHHKRFVMNQSRTHLNMLHSADQVSHTDCMMNKQRTCTPACSLAKLLFTAC